MASSAQTLTEIETLLNSGAVEVEVDGVKVKYDTQSLRTAQRELIAADEAQAGKRPVAARINLGGF